MAYIKVGVVMAPCLYSKFHAWVQPGIILFRKISFKMSNDNELSYK